MEQAPRRVAFVGSRECGSHIQRTREILAVMRSLGDIEVVSGGAGGIDSLSERAARALGLPVRVLLADWRTHGKKAGLMRNADIVKLSDEVHAWWDGKSRGTAHTISLARKAGKPVTVHDCAFKPELP